MICMILLFINLTCCGCGMSELHNMALNYQGEENSDITVRWCFSPKTDISIPSLKIHCVSVAGLKVFYHLDNSVEESQHEQFAGRVQCDKDALRAGCVQLLLSRVRTDDSGLYLCRMATEFGRKVKEFSLNVAKRVALDATADEESSDAFPTTPKLHEGAKRTPEGPKKDVISKYLTQEAVNGVVLVIASIIVVLAAAERCVASIFRWGNRDPNPLENIKKK